MTQTYGWGATAEFANPWHDEVGRFARKGYGKRFPPADPGEYLMGMTERMLAAIEGEIGIENAKEMIRAAQKKARDGLLSRDIIDRQVVAAWDPLECLRDT